MTTPSLEARFATLVAELEAAMPDEESATQIVVAFKKMWEKPPLEALELVLQRTTSLADARLLLFFPEPVDMVRYVALIQGGPRGSPDNHPQNKLQRPFLSLLYMRHVRAWPLMREFILEGGLTSLVRLFEAENMYLRAQAVDSFMQLTSTELHDWFAEPVLEPKVHRRWVDLASPDSGFIRAIQANFAGSHPEGSPFPGSSFYALQILAFWLSVLRYFYCEQRVMRLGTKLMELIRRWAACEGLPPEEHDLAKKLTEDFGRFPTVEAMDGQLIGAAGLGDASAGKADGAANERLQAVVEEVGDADAGAGNDDAAETGAARGAGGARDEAEAGGPVGSDGDGAEDAEGAEGAPMQEPLLLPPQPPAEAAPATASTAKKARPQGPIVLTDKKASEALKEAGNAALKRGEPAEAVRSYTAALDTAPPSMRHLLLSNRCAAYLRLRYLRMAPPPPPAALPRPDGSAAADPLLEKAVADATECVRLQPDFAKGHYRLGQALLALGRPTDAVAAFEGGLKASPYSDDLRTGLRSAREAQEVAAAQHSNAPAVAAAASPTILDRAPAPTGAVPAAGDALGELPKSYQQFEREWAALAKATPTQRRTWLQRLPATQYESLFKESLTEATLASLLSCVHDALLPGGLSADADADADAAPFVVEVLQGLARTRRFGMLLMFLDDRPKALVNRVFKTLRNVGQPASAELARTWEAKA